MPRYSMTEMMLDTSNTMAIAPRLSQSLERMESFLFFRRANTFPDLIPVIFQKTKIKNIYNKYQSGSKRKIF